MKRLKCTHFSFAAVGSFHYAQAHVGHGPAEAAPTKSETRTKCEQKGTKKKHMQKWWGRSNNKRCKKYIFFSSFFVYLFPMHSVVSPPFSVSRWLCIEGDGYIGWATMDGKILKCYHEWRPPTAPASSVRVYSVHCVPCAVCCVCMEGVGTDAASAGQFYYKSTSRALYAHLTT